ncbi:MAG: aminotransferase class I/II-fold pyridoxal phosphate-dependent enzyme [Firmicutes bacterium]|nr:aminotransferase class I/II-fold pyridoxal phosphate-dependent enzyme [Bacillota bacterium]
MESTLDKNLLKEFYLDYGFQTRALHAGEHVLQPGKAISHANAIYQSSTFVFQNSQEGKELFSAKKDGYIYTRLGNPTTTVFEAKMNALEGKEVKMKDPDNTRVSSVAFASGMAAISSTALALLGNGDKVIRGDSLYGCTEDLFLTTLPKYGINAISVDTSDLEMFKQVMQENPDAKMVYFETPTNPTLKVTDIEALSKFAKSVNPDIYIVVDNTFCTPYLQRPLALGADVSLHSTTKYIGGHGVLIGGIAVTHRDAIKDKLYHMVKDLGGCPSPFDTWLANLGLKTLPLRMERICSNTRVIAHFLRNHNKVEYVYYPGFEDHPHYDVARKQMKDFGGMISFEVKGGYDAAVKLLDNIHIFSLAVSLGSVDSLIQHPASMTHATVPEEIRLKTGVTDGLIRISVGIEDVEDLLAALEKALELI